MRTISRQGQRLATRLVCEAYKSPLTYGARATTAGPRLLHTTIAVRQQTQARPVDQDVWKTMKYREKSLFVYTRHFGDPTPEAQDLETRLQSGELNPMATLRDYITKGEVTYEILRLCLISARHEVRKSHRDEGRIHSGPVAATNPDPIAKLAISYIRSHPELWKKIVFFDRAALDALCYLAIVERTDALVVDWINDDLDAELQEQPFSIGQQSSADAQLQAQPISIDQQSPADTPLGHPDIWRGAVLSALVRESLTTTTGNSARDAISFLLAASDRIKSHPDCKVSVVPAASNLKRDICGGNWFNTPEELYDQFVTLYQSLQPQIRFAMLDLDHRKTFDAAMFALNHPTRPSADLALRILRSRDSEERASLARQGRLRRQHMMQQAHILTEVQGRHSDAAWISKIYSNAFGEPVPVSIAYGQRFPSIPRVSLQDHTGLGYVVSETNTPSKIRRVLSQRN